MRTICIGYNFQSYDIDAAERSNPLYVLKRYAKYARKATRVMDAQGALYHYEVVEREQWNWNNNRKMPQAAGLGMLAVVHVYSDDILLLMRLRFDVLPLREDWREWYTTAGEDIHGVSALNFLEAEA